LRRKITKILAHYMYFNPKKHPYVHGKLSYVRRDRPGHPIFFRMASTISTWFLQLITY